MAYQLARRIRDEAPLVNSARLGSSGYIDAIERDRADHGPEVIEAELRLPPGTLYHRNEYQRRTPVVRGNAVPGANVNLRVFTADNGAHISHRNIDKQGSVQDRFYDDVLDRLQEMP